MKSIEKYIREKLGLPDAPAEVDADDLWAGIEQQLAPAGKRPSPMPWPWKSLFFGLLLLVIGGMAWWLLQERINSADAADTSGQESIAIVETTTSSPSSTSATALGGKSQHPTAVSTASANVPEEKTSSSKTSSSGGASHTNLALRKPFAAPASAPKSQASRTTRPGSASSASASHTATAELNVVLNEPNNLKPTGNQTDDPVQAERNTTEEENTSLKSSSDETVISIPRAPSFIATATLPSLPMRALVRASIGFSLPAITAPKPFKSTLNNRLSLGLNAGTNLLSTRYATPTDGPGKALNTAIKPAAGGSFGLDVRYQINKKFALSTGLEYHRTINTFEHTIERDTMINHPSPLNSGQVDAILSHRIADNLRTRFITVPVLLHWNQSLGNLRLGIGVGVGLNFRQFANGTTLSPVGDFVPFDAATGPTTTPKTFLSYQLSPSIAYRLKPEGQLSLEAKADLRYLPFGADELSGLKRNSFISGISIGIRYGL